MWVFPGYQNIIETISSFILYCGDWGRPTRCYQFHRELKEFHFEKISGCFDRQIVHEIITKKIREREGNIGFQSILRKIKRMVPKNINSIYGTVGVGMYTRYRQELWSGAMSTIVSKITGV